MATCAGSPQTAIRARGSNKCSKHYGKEVVYFCENCTELVCGDCVIQEHKGHVFEGLSNVVPAAKQRLQDFITKAEQTDIPSIHGKLQAADNDLTKNKNHLKNQISKIRKQNEALKKEFDKLTETFVKTCQEIEKQNLGELLTYKKDLQTRIDKLTSQIKDAKGSLQSGNDILMFDMSHVTSEMDDLPSKPICSTPEFTIGKFSVQELEQLLGKLNITVQTQSLNQPGKCKVTSEFTPYAGHLVRSIHRAVGNQAWFSFFSNNLTGVKRMLLTDESGHVKQTLDMSVGVQDFCVLPNSGDMWFCSDKDNTVREVKGGKTTIKFSADTDVKCMCMTNDDHVILGHDRQVVKYRQGGQVVCRTKRGNTPAVRSPWHLSQCPLTSNIAAVDQNRSEEGGNDKLIVSILNSQLQRLNTYTGEVQGQSPTKSFKPYNVVFTSAGELVITDFNNRSVVLLTGRGEYLRTLYTNSQSGALAVCVHSGALWVSFEDGGVKVLKNM